MMIEFIEDEHIYLNDGVIVPSVSQLVKYATGEDFSNIPYQTLKNACDFGSDIHLAIQMYLTDVKDKEFQDPWDDPYRRLAFKEFKRLYAEEIDKDNVLCEQITSYKGRYVGTYDCLSNTTLIDFKTNTNINIPHLEWQLGLYKLALESLGQEVKKTMCLWLPKRKSGKWVEISAKSKEECLKILEDYEEENNE